MWTSSLNIHLQLDPADLESINLRNPLLPYRLVLLDQILERNQYCQASCITHLTPHYNNLCFNSFNTMDFQSDDYGPIKHSAHILTFIRDRDIADQDISSYELIDREEAEVAEKKAMSHSCNFMNWMSTSRRQTPSASQDGRRASSFDELTKLEPPDLDHRSASGNHLAIGDSADTICDPSETQTNRGSSAQSSQSPTKPLQIDIGSTHVASISDPDNILKIDMDEATLDAQLGALENEALYWEEKVEKLERQQFAEDVPRTLVDSIIRLRKEIRELDTELYIRQLYSEDQLVEDMDESLYVSDRRSSKFGSHLKPGQENTADVLYAVPPSSALQRLHYLNKASGATDTSEYSQLPSFDRHSHKIVRHHKISYQPQNEKHFIDDNLGHPVQQNHQQREHHRVSRRHVQQQHQNQQLYVSLSKSNLNDSHNRSPDCASPIRPDHFKSDFRSPQLAPPQDPSSTASSSSSQ